jgi:HSP20 family protein
MSDTTVKTGNVGEKEQVQGKPGPLPRRLTFTPQVDILELPSELVLQVDMPGARSEDVEVHFERGELTVHGKRQALPRSGRCLVEEFEVGDFYRAFLISQDIAADKINAELKNGVLTVHLPRAEAAQPRRISVKGV